MAATSCTRGQVVVHTHFAQSTSVGDEPPLIELWDVRYYLNKPAQVLSSAQDLQSVRTARLKPSHQITGSG